ncbi:MAG: 2-hydroxyacid dehydrogenase [Burkholderiaceae bacterium]
MPLDVMHRGPRLLQIGPLPDGLQQRLDASYTVDRLWLEPDRAAFLAQAAPYAGAVTMSRHGCDDLVLQALAGRVLACFGVGTERIDLPAARRHGVTVSNTPDVLTGCVADFAWGLLLAVARQIPQAHAFVRSGSWTQRSYGLGTRVHGRRLGIVGLGRIGMAIRHRASGFDMDIRYQGPSAKTGVPGFEPDLRALATWADYLMVTAPGGPSTQHLIDASVLKALGPQGILVNVARGSVVDEEALQEALRQSWIQGVGLDVFEREPDVPAALLTDDRVVVQPHIAASTRETRADMEQLVLDNLSAFLSDGQVLTPVD